MTKLSVTAAGVIAGALAAGAAGAEMSRAEAQAHLERAFPNVAVSAVRPAALPGVYEVISDGSVYYLSGDGRFMLAGTLYDLKAGVNLTERTRSGMRRNAVENIGDDETIVYAPRDYQYTVNVFSDPECPYCRKFHSQIEQYNERGIRVRYLLLPLLGERARKQAIGVWCSRDRRAALDRAKLDAPVAAVGDCDHPIDKNLGLAELLGVHATPALLLENGKLINGYRSPVELLQAIKKEGIKPRG